MDGGGVHGTPFVNTQSGPPDGFAKGVVRTQPRERLCFLSRGNCDEFGIPGRVVFQHGVEGDEELSSAGGDMIVAVTGFETLGKFADACRFDMGVVNEIESCQVESRANAGSSAEDGTLALILAAVTVEGRDTDEGRDLLTIEFAELWEIGQDRRTGRRTDTRNGLQDFCFAAPVVVAVDEALDLGIDVVDLPLETIEDLVDTLASGFGMTGTAAIGLHGSHGDQLPTANDKLFKFRGFFRRFLERPRFDIVCEPSQSSGVNAVRLRPGQCPDRNETEDAG